MPRNTQLLRGTSIALTITTALSAQATDWVELTPPARPAARQNSALAYDTVRGVSVLFGGWDGGQRRNDTWEWNGTLWTQVNTANAPTPRDAMSLAYDALRQVVVCTAGYVAADETWEYDGNDWTQVLTANAHGMGPHRPMTFDLMRGVCILYGQSTVTGNYETWEYDGIDWTQTAPTGGPGFNGNLAYDLIRARTVHFGDSGQTWEYDGVAWTLANPNTSPPGAGCGSANMVYDLVRQRVVLYGGCGGTADTWEYDGTDWTLMATANVPSASLQYPAMAYDLNRGRTVLFGGRDMVVPPGVVADGTWEYGTSGTLAANTVYGTGCGGLALVGVTRAVTNSNWNFDLDNVPAGAIVGAIVFGTSNPNLALGGVAPGCTQYSDATFAAVLPLPVSSPAYGLTIPGNTNLIGLDLFAQGVALVPGANALGIAASGGVRGTMGDI